MNMLDKFAEVLSSDALARSRVMKLAQENGITVDVGDHMDGHFDSRYHHPDIPNKYFGADIRIFIGEKSGDKFLLGIPPKPGTNTEAFLVRKVIQAIVKEKDGTYRILNSAAPILFVPVKQGKEVV